MRRTPKPPLWIFIALGLLLYFIFRIHQILIPFALSFALAYLLNPVIHFYEVRGWRREHIVLSLYLILTVAVTISANFLIPTVASEIKSLKTKVPEYISFLEDNTSRVQKQLARHIPYGKQYIETMDFKMYDPVMQQLPRIPTYVLGLMPLFSLLFLVPFITFFILMDSKKLLQEAIQLCPSRYVEQALHVVSEVDTALGNYIRGILIIAGVIAYTSYVGLKILQVDYALAIAALSGIASFIPYLGAIIGMIVGSLVAYFQYYDYAIPMRVIVLFILIRLADEAVVQPIVARRSVHLHPVAFLLALMVGGELFGFIGLLFAVPAACVLKALIGVAWDWYVSESQLAPPVSEDGSHIPFT